MTNTSLLGMCFFFKYLPNYKKPEEEQNDNEEEDYDNWVARALQPVPV